MNLSLDAIFGLMIAYVLFKIVDYYAIKYDIEVLKSGVYMDESVNLLNNEGEKTNPDSHINYKIWIMQVLVWCLIVLLSKIIVFFFEIVYCRPVYLLGEEILSPLNGSPQI